MKTSRTLVEGTPVAAAETLCEMLPWYKLGWRAIGDFGMSCIGGRNTATAVTPEVRPEAAASVCPLIGGNIGRRQ